MSLFVNVTKLLYVSSIPIVLTSRRDFELFFIFYCKSHLSMTTAEAVETFGELNQINTTELILMNFKN